MIYILHGDDVVKSRSLLINHQKKLNIETKTDLNISETSPSQFFDAISSSDLFGKFPLVVLDVTSAKNKNLEDYTKVLLKAPKDSSVVIYSEKPLPKTSPFLKIPQELNAKIIQNDTKPDSNIFKFIDALFTKNRKNTYSELEKLTRENTDPFYIFTMVLYGLRNLALEKFDKKEFNKLASFTKVKTQKISPSFSETNIKHLYKKMYDLDKRAKTGCIDPEIMLLLAIEAVLA